MPMQTRSNAASTVKEEGCAVLTSISTLSVDGESELNFLDTAVSDQSFFAELSAGINVVRI